MPNKEIYKLIRKHSIIANIFLGIGGLLLSILILFGSLKITGNTIVDIPSPFVQLVFILILVKAIFFIILGIYRKKFVREFKIQMEKFGY